MDPARLLTAWLKRGGRPAPAGVEPDPSEGDPILPGIAVRAQPVLTEQEALYYNLLRLTVQDQYLLFAQIPLWCLLEITGPDRNARATMLNRIALKRVDFALVHPGSLALAKVIELDDPMTTSDKKQARDRLLDALFAAAGVELVRLDIQRRYTVPELADLLGLASED